MLGFGVGGGVCVCGCVVWVGLGLCSFFFYYFFIFVFNKENKFHPCEKILGRVFFGDWVGFFSLVHRCRS